MRTPSAIFGDDARPSRRQVLRLGLGLPLLGVGLSACTVSPVIQRSGPVESSAGAPSGPHPSPPSPAPAPTVPAAATHEQQLSVCAAAVLTGPHRGDLGKANRKLLGFLRDAHAQHALALAGTDPASRPTSAAPSPTAAAPTLTKLSLKASLGALAKAESAQGERQRRAALAGTGLTALLDGSLAVAAATFAQALTAAQAPAVQPIAAHRPAPLLSDVAATQAVVGQLQAMIYGYQFALGQLKVGSAARSRAYAGLADQRALLDDLVAALDRRSADVPPAAPAYAPSPTPRTAGGAGRLLQQMHTRLQPYAGLLLAAAASPADRTRAFSILSDTTTAARRWGAPLRAWPGWAD